ncbi:MAG TPA: BadF/BadG/BcrA/BcrD ATPase family protein [Candidatus Kryptonia bacterium]|nr:BadF/BadG/BcrA/BcrD ATPase family protein [Candidatus Kryptonia bacterium]
MILAIDAGGSSTRALLIRRDGRVLGRGRGGPGNHALCGWDVTERSIRDAVKQACEPAAVDAVRCAVVGSAGVGSGGESGEMVVALLSELFPRARVSVTGDMVAAFWGALTSEHGVVVAAGTGSVCYGRNRAGESRQVGGWGHVMGDEGSAYDLAVRALRAGARATDGRGPRTALSERIAEALGVGDFVAVAFRVYGEPMAREAIARLATIVAEAAAAGDAVARALLDDAGRELGVAAVGALRALDLSEIATTVAYTGAVFDAGTMVVDAFKETIIAAAPRASVCPAEFPPVIGAFKLALRDLNTPFSAEVAAALRATMESVRR